MICLATIITLAYSFVTQCKMTVRNVQTDVVAPYVCYFSFIFVRLVRSENARIARVMCRGHMSSVSHVECEIDRRTCIRLQ